MTRPPARRSFTVVAAFLALVAALPAPAVNAYPRPGRTEMVTRAIGGEPDSYSHEPRISADGRFVAFQSDSTNLVPDDTNGQGDVFVRDLAEGVTRRASVAADGSQADFNTGAPSLSSSGRFITFSTRATNILPDDTNGTWDIGVKDMQTGAIHNASVAGDGTQANGLSASPSGIALDEGLVAFESDATNLVPGDTNGHRDVFLHDVKTGTTTMVSVTADGTQGNGASTAASISADGNIIAFQSVATNLVAGDANGMGDVFVKDLRTGALRMASVSTHGVQANMTSGGPLLSADGTVVAFTSAAYNLVPADGNSRTNPLGIGDVYVHDLASARTERVSVSSEGVEASSVTGGAGISADGRYVTMQSSASNLVPNDTNARPDLFLHDRLTGITERVDLSADGTQGTGGFFGSSRAVPNADASVVAFATDNPNLVPGDTGAGFDSDIFVRRRGPALGVSEMRAQRAGNDVTVEGLATFSGLVGAAATDPAGDGDERVGADLAAVTVVARPEAEDLLVRIGVTRLPAFYAPAGTHAQVGTATSGIAGAPAIVHAFSFRLGGISYEARALRAGVSAAPPGAPLFALYRCESACVETTRLAGGYGTTGEEIRFAIPISALGGSGSADLTNVGVVAGLGEAAAGVLHPLDSVAVPDVKLALPVVELGIAPAGQPEDQVPFQTEASLANGVFSAMLGHPSGTAGRLWARACIRSTCSATSAPVPA